MKPRVQCQIKRAALQAVGVVFRKAECGREGGREAGKEGGQEGEEENSAPPREEGGAGRDLRA